MSAHPTTERAEVARKLSVQLSPEDAATVRTLFGSVLPAAQVVVFGSRATGRARPFSDLDLLLLAPDNLSWAERAALSDAFEASRLPFRVDVVELSALPPVMRTRALAEAKPLPSI